MQDTGAHGQAASSPRDAAAPFAGMAVAEGLGENWGLGQGMYEMQGMADLSMSSQVRCHIPAVPVVPY